MVHTIRLAGGLTGGVASVLTAAIQTGLAVNPPPDDATRSHWAIAAAVLGVIAIIGILTFAVAEFIRDRRRDALDRKRDKRERRRDKTLQELLTRMAAMSQVGPNAELTPTETASTAARAESIETPPPKPTATTLWQAAVDLAAEIRAFAESVPDGLSLEQEHERLFERFLTTYWQRLQSVKDRLENVVLPRWSVFNTTEWLPNSKQNVMNIANSLEREALKVDKDLPL